MRRRRACSRSRTPSTRQPPSPRARRDGCSCSPSAGRASPGCPRRTGCTTASTPRVRDQFDVVVYDPRSTGQSEFRDCPDAATAYYAEDGLPTAPSARTFAERCIAESGADALDLARYGTRAVAEDIDALRDVLGVERISLYGVSYGTVVAQAYAAAHPDRVDALVLDAPVDRSLPPAESWAVSAVGIRVGAAGHVRRVPGGLLVPRRPPRPRPGVDAAARRDGAPAARDAAVRRPRLRVPGDDHARRPRQHDAGRDVRHRPTGCRSCVRSRRIDREDSRGLARLWDAWSGASADSSFAYFATWCADGRHSPTSAADDFDAYVRVAPARRRLRSGAR